MNPTTALHNIVGNEGLTGGEGMRSVFFDDCDAVIFVWDVSDESTYHSLHRWLMEINARSDVLDMDDNGKSVFDSDIESGGNKCNIESPPRSVSRAKSGVKHRPLLLVGNKIDKLAPSQLAELKTACPQQIFISALAGVNPSPFVKFFSEVYEGTYGDAHNGLELGGLGLRSNQYTTTTASAAANQSPVLPSFMSSPDRLPMENNHVV